MVFALRLNDLRKIIRCIIIPEGHAKLGENYQPEKGTERMWIKPSYYKSQGKF